MDPTLILHQTRHWISSFVIGLNLCPFARCVFDAELIRFVVSDVVNEESLLQVLSEEQDFLAAASPGSTETTLIIHPQVLEQFPDYLEFLDLANHQLSRKGYQGILQLASFHPNYQFADTTPSAAENYTNRSPYPMLHLLREVSISKVATDTDALLNIPRRNQSLLNEMGITKIQKMLDIVTANNPHP